MIDIQAYSPSWFGAQLGFSQTIVRSPRNMQCRIGSLQDARNAWKFATAFDTCARYTFGKYQEQRSHTDCSDLDLTEK